ncbi:hypothetical protein [Mesoaciditoga lauensis]|uniref:hypothetical protein n=1 Tax=Mesoaciditoga lauensis TaxID=1495039 RepID=UPI0012E04B92|nr:hypothetical protein [Mesoaciditoga lauensis]
MVIGFSFYFISTKMIDGIYASSLSADKNLLNAAGVSSFSNLSKEDMQRRIDEQIERYSTLLNSKSRTLSYIKDTLQNVDNFHFTFYSLQNVLGELKGQISLSYLEYSTNPSTPLEIIQFTLENSDTVSKELSYFKSVGFSAQVTIGKSKWYKTTSEKIYLSRGAK